MGPKLGALVYTYPRIVEIGFPSPQTSTTKLPTCVKGGAPVIMTTYPKLAS